MSDLPWKTLSDGEQQLDVVQLVKEGRARFDWHWVEVHHPEDLDVVLRYAVLRDAMRFDGIPSLDWYRRKLPGDGTTRDGVRLPASAEELQQIADIVGGSMLTPSMVDQIWLQASMRFDAIVNSGYPNYRIVATMPILDLHHRIEEAISKAGGDDGSVLISCVGKYWVLYNQLESVGMVAGDYAACNYGWAAKVASGPGLTPGTQVYQRPGYAHNKQHLDPSQTIRLVWTTCELSRDGGSSFHDVPLVDVFEDPSLAALVTADGKPLVYQRQKGVEKLPQGGIVVMPPMQITIHVPESGTHPPQISDPDDPVPQALPPQQRPVLREGDDGPWVEILQHRLGDFGIPLVVDGDFGAATKRAVERFQRERGFWDRMERRSLNVDGIVGRDTWRALGETAPGEDFDKSGRHGWENGVNGPYAWRPDHSESVLGPPSPPFKPIAGNWGRQRVFGKFSFRPAPTANNPEGIQILGNWVSENIVTVEIPQLVKIPGLVHGGRRVGQGPSSGKVQCHRMVAEQLKGLWQAWEEADLLKHVITWAGLWNPRFIRGSRSVLSNHAFGTAFDINAPWNGLGRPPADGGSRGTVWPLVPLAYEWGFYWGGKFSRQDGMHFEVAVPGAKP